MGPLQMGCRAKRERECVCERESVSRGHEEGMTGEYGSGKDDDLRGSLVRIPCEGEIWVKE